MYRLWSREACKQRVIAEGIGAVSSSEGGSSITKESKPDYQKVMEGTWNMLTVIMAEMANVKDVA